ncbi:MAG: gluconate 2-dehydrogenase subunit 3 family protein, partial [Thaumarchaeota archaeon]|nr:gluconate 2-dehydrogenase subunit 3 family protein [Nitrososphaerota archaeon]
TTVTSTGPGTTVTSTAPGSTVTSTAPGTTVTSTATTTLPAVTDTTTVTQTATSQFISVQDQLDTQTAFLSLSSSEQVELAAIASAIIPSDSTGPGATEAGAIYFIDRQLRSSYGQSGSVYRKGPFVPANVTTAFTVAGISYPGASVTYTAGGTNYTVQYNPTANVRVGAGTRLQYAFDMKEFWTIGLAGIQAYSNAAYGGNYETLTAANQTQVLTDLWNNKPTYNGVSGSVSGGAAGGYQEVIEGVNAPYAGVPGGTQFGAVLPSDFAYELFFMVWNGFWVDPIHGGNKGMVGWSYIAFHGVNLGNFYGEGYTSKQLMVANTPITLQPASLGQYQKGSP